MAIPKYLQRIRQFEQLVRLKATGKSDDFAEKLGISKSVLYQMIEDLKTEGLPIAYDKCRQSFYYQEQGELKILSFEKCRKLEHTEMENTSAGHSKFSFNFFEFPKIQETHQVFLQHRY